MLLVDHIEELFIGAEPRLLRLARTQRIAPDAVEDIVQETLLEACYGVLPGVRDFLFGAGRIKLGPEVEMAYAGQPAIRFRLLSLNEGRHLLIFADAGTLLPLAVSVE